LVEVLTATVLTLILMSILTGVFSQITDAINTSRATIELNSQLTGVAYRLQKDLEGYTVRPDPNRKDFSDGYFTFVEGPLGTTFIPDLATEASTNSLGGAIRDTTLGDRDDIIMWTTRSRHEPFVGRLGTETFSSEVAEVAWFLRGTTLYRRVLLVGNPTINSSPVATTIAWWQQNGANYQRQLRSNLGTAFPPATADPWNPATQGFYGYADLSVRVEGNAIDPDATTASGGVRIIPNTLADLSVPRNRYCFPSSAYISDVRFWSKNTGFGLPVLGECSNPSFQFPVPGGVPGAVPTTVDSFDQLLKRYPYDLVDSQTGRVSEPAILADPTNNRRINEDVIMTNVIGFDVKIWDPGAPVYSSGGVAVLPGQISPVAYTSLVGGAPLSYGAYVNLGYAPNYAPGAGAPAAHFNGLGDAASRLRAGEVSPVDPAPPASAVRRNAAVYDTYTSVYESDGLDQLSTPGWRSGPDEGTNGFDDNGIGGIDDVTEKELPPPYPFPMRGIQITIRVIEPDTQQIREVVVQQDFVLE